MSLDFRIARHEFAHEDRGDELDEQPAPPTAEGRTSSVEDPFRSHFAREKGSDMSSATRQVPDFAGPDTCLVPFGCSN
jgi:hypothetical protein